MHIEENGVPARRDVVVVGASAGGVEALADLVRALPADFDGCLLIVLHVPPNATSALPGILRRVGLLPVRHASSGDLLERGTILVAPPDQHLVVYDDAVTLSRGPTENGHRPAVDVLFRTAATVLGSRVTGVVLSGSLDDGAAGLVAVRLRGGNALVQDPDEALHPGMPRAAIKVADVQEVLPVKEIAHRLVEIVREEAPAPPPVTELMEMEAAMANLDPAAMHDLNRPGRPSGWSCPDCQGTLFEIHEGGLTRFRCRVGHAWSAAGLVAQQSASMDSALWMALRALEEKAALTGELGLRAEERGHRLTAEQFTHQAQEAHQAAMLVRDLISRISGAEHDVPPDEVVGGS